MLGSMVKKHLSAQEDIVVMGTNRSGSGGELAFDASRIHSASDLGKASFDGIDYAINCIGIINKYCRDNDLEGLKNAVQVNSLFPHYLSGFCEERGVRLIRIATDCVFSGREGGYDEDSVHDAPDVYGKTMSLGEVRGPAALNIRCSIVGPELKNKTSLLEWFLSIPDGETVPGFTHHRWNGVTTLQFARLCHEIVRRPATFDQLTTVSNTHHFVPNEALSKFELLGVFKDKYGKDVKIEKESRLGRPVDRTLSTKYQELGRSFGPESIRDAVGDL